MILANVSNIFSADNAKMHCPKCDEYAPAFGNTATVSKVGIKMVVMPFKNYLFYMLTF